MSTKKSEPVIRAAEFHDAEAIFKLIRSYPRELITRSMSDIVQNIDRFVVCEVGGRIVGTISWAIMPEIGAPRNPSVEIKSLSVNRRLRKSGIGRMLVQAAIDRIQTLHPAKIIALTFAPGFFRKMGFRTTSKRKLLHKIYAGCINCLKYNSPLTCPEVAMMLPLQEPAKPTRS